MGQQTFAFQPGATAANTSNIAVVATNLTFTLSPSVGSDGGTVCLTNIGTQTVFFALGTVTASITTSMPLLANTSQTFSLPGGINTLSVIAGAAGSQLYATIGIGI